MSIGRECDEDIEPQIQNMLDNVDNHYLEKFDEHDLLSHNHKI